MRRELAEAIPPIRILYRFRGRNEINGYSKQAGAAQAVINWEVCTTCSVRSRLAKGAWLGSRRGAGKPLRRLERLQLLKYVGGTDNPSCIAASRELRRENPVNKANNGSLSKRADAAFQQAAAQVIKQAKQSGTPVIIWEGAGVKAVASETIQLVKKPRNTRKARKKKEKN
jgi:hypothetical protein